MNEKPRVQIPDIGGVPISIVPICLKTRFEISVSSETEAVNRSTHPLHHAATLKQNYGRTNKTAVVSRTK